MSLLLLGDDRTSAPADGLHCWRMGESSSPFADTGGSSSPVSLSLVGSAAAAATPLFGNETCAKLTADGSGGDGARATGILLDLTQPFSIAWAASLSPTSTGQSVPVWELSDGTVTNSILFLWNWLYGPRYRVSTTDGAYGVVAPSSAPNVVGSTHTFAVAFTPLGGGNWTIRWYQDGAFVATDTVSLGTTPTTATSFGALASYAPGMSSRSGDRFGEARLYNFALDDTQAAAIDVSQRQISSAELALHRWRLGEADAPFDDTGNAMSHEPMILLGAVAGGGTPLFGHESCLALTADGTGGDGAYASVTLDLTQPFSVAWAMDLTPYRSNVSIPVWEFNDGSSSNVLTLLANWSVGTCYLSVVGGTTNVAISQPGPASAGWIGLHTFAVSFVPTGGGHMTTTWWVDGAPAFTGTTSLTSAIAVATEFRVLCARFAGGGLTSHVGDRIGEARLYDRILTDTQVAAIDASMRAT